MKQKQLKKITALILIFILAIQVVPENRAEAATIYSSQLEVNVDSETGMATQDITPKVTMTWEKLPESTKNEIRTENTETYIDVAEFFYELVITEMGSGSEYPARIEEDVLGSGSTASIELNKDTPQKFQFPEEYELENGKFYTARVVAKYRINIYEADAAAPGGKRLVAFRYEEAEQTTEIIPFITNFNTEIVPLDGRVQIEWDYIEGASYQLYWTDEITPTQEGINITKEDIMQKVDPILIDPDTARELLDPETNKIIYTIYDSQSSIYTAFVEHIGPIQVGDIIYTDIEKGSSPKVALTISQALLEIDDIDTDRIRLRWQIPDWLNVIIKGGDVTIEVYAREGDGNNRKIQDIPALIGETVLARPKQETSYYIRIIDIENEITIQSNEAVSGPYEIKEKPVRPRIPLPSNRMIFDGLQSGEGAQYVIQGFGENVFSTWQRYKERAFYTDLTNETGIQLVWENLGEEVDYALVYDIWVTTDKSALNIEEDTPTYENIEIKEGNVENVIYTAAGEAIGLRYRLSEYTNEQGAEVDITSNKTYYIQLVAKKPYRDGYVLSEPNIVSITIGPTGEISTPPVLGKPPLKLDAVTTNEATIKWRESWYEILATPQKQVEYLPEDGDERLLAEMGSGRVYTGQGSVPEIRYIAEEGLTEHTLLQQGDVDAVKNSVGSSYTTDYYDRFISLGQGIEYELKTVPYNEVITDMQTNYGEDVTIENWVKEQGNGSNISEIGWQSIVPTTKVDERNLEWQFHTLSNLLPNTKYVMMLRTYRMVDGQKKVQTFPSYIICTTLTDYEGPEATPTVPILSLEAKTDTSISVNFKYNQNFDYEVVYSRLEDPDTANVWEVEFSNDSSSEFFVPDGGRAVVKINGLFPETTYNIWVKAKQKQGALESAWSNPVTAKTQAVMTPKPPTGLGLADYQSILEAGRDFPPLASDYITVEWLKNPNDLGDITEGSMERAYTYILEFADNVEFLDSITIETTDNGEKVAVEGVDVLDKTIVRVNNLIANRPYYARVKTKITLTETAGERVISRESEYTNWVRIITATSTEEYDGGENENVVIYPEKIKETYQKGVWTLEVLDTQKIISELVGKKAYFYTINMELYRNKTDATTRRIQMDKSLLDAMANRKMELEVITNIGNYRLPAESIAYYLETASAAQRVQIDFTTLLPYDVASYSKAYPYTLQKAEALSISMRGKNAVTKLNGRIRIEQKLTNESDAVEKNVQGFTFDASLGDWVKENQSIQFKQEGAYLSYATDRVGIYATYHLENYAQNPQTNTSMTYLMSQYSITGLGEPYTSGKEVGSNQFIQLLLGVAQNQQRIHLVNPPTNQQVGQATMAGLYTQEAKDVVTQEEAIAGVVKLYELKNGRAIKATATSPTPVSREYRDSVAKALSIGLIQSVDPQEAITYGQLCDLIVQVLP